MPQVGFKLQQIGCKVQQVGCLVQYVYLLGNTCIFVIRVPDRSIEMTSFCIQHFNHRFLIPAVLVFYHIKS